MNNRASNIKNHVHMTDVLSLLNLLPSSAEGEFQMRCPFHGQDSKPSARIYRNQLFKCFACGVAYDVISFYSEYKKVNFRDSCYLLEKQFNVKWDESSEIRSSNPETRPSKAPTHREISLSDLVRITEKQLIERKKDLGLEKYAKSFYVLDRAEENENIEMIKSLRSKLGLSDVTRRFI
jgi:hypothetical protein